MTTIQIKNFLVKKSSYLRWSTDRLTQKIYSPGAGIIKWLTVNKAKELAKNYIKSKGGKW